MSDPTRATVRAVGCPILGLLQFGRLSAALTVVPQIPQVPIPGSESPVENILASNPAGLEIVEVEFVSPASEEREPIKNKT